MADAEPQTGDPLALLSLCRADLAAAARVAGVAYPTRQGLAHVLGVPGTWAVLVFRVANALHYKGLRPLSRLLSLLNVLVFRCELSPGAQVGPGFAVPHPAGVGIVSGARLGRGVTLMPAVRLGGGGFEDKSKDGAPVIGDDCTLFDGAKAFGPVSVGARSVVCVNAWINRDMPADSLVSGSPGKVIGPRRTPSTAAGDVLVGRHTAGAPDDGQHG